MTAKKTTSVEKNLSRSRNPSEENLKSQTRTKSFKNVFKKN